MSNFIYLEKDIILTRFWCDYLTLNRKNEIIHFLLLGMSWEHILLEIAFLKFQNVVFFTSENLLENSQPLFNKVKVSGVNILEIVCLKPFEPNSLGLMTEKISEVYWKYANNTIVAGLTGGTNLMVAAMTLNALKYGLVCHYAVKNTQEIYYISYIKDLHDAGNIIEAA
ncbi:hypothetical protein [Methanocorpusculum bavaricum]|uniref:hypothetical protein n=1 Tax=Methanocorpusculum bavaricum TaxID=71518 RepID=UPI0005B272C0|nr:hypothetical protein [Methanocorpusculum bavaricum]